MRALAADNGGLVSTFHCGLANQQKINRNITSIAVMNYITVVTVTSWRMLTPLGHNIVSNITRGVNPELDSIFSLSVNHLACFGVAFAV